jgi:small GTP-binding protein
MRLKVVVVGDNAHGKTSLVKTFCNGKFEPEIGSTVFGIYSKDMQLDGDCRIGLALSDTAGAEDYDRLRSRFSVMYAGPGRAGSQAGSY